MLLIEILFQFPAFLFDGKNILKEFLLKSADWNRIGLASHCGLDLEKCLISSSWLTSEVFLPGHYLAIDHTMKSIVFVIRGTLSGDDVLTDLICNYEPFMVIFIYNFASKCLNKGRKSTQRDI